MEKTIILIKRIFKSGVKNFTRQANLSLAACLILTLTISLISFLFLSYKILNEATAEIREKADISVYFQIESSDEVIFDLKDKLAALEGVREVEYVSRDNALSQFIEKHRDDQALMDSLVEVGANPFLAYFNIKAETVDTYERVVEFLKNEEFAEFIEKVDYHQRRSAIEKIFEMTGFLDQAGIFVSLIFILASVLITFNTIRLAIYSQQEEVKIMKLVGASSWFVRGPFLVQGGICGLLSSSVAFLIVVIACLALSPNTPSFFSGFGLFSFFKVNFGVIILIQFFSGLILGIVPSLIAIRKFLAV